MANQLLGGTLGVSIGGAIVLNKLQTGVREYAPGLSDDLVKQVARSVSAIHDVPPEYLAGVIRAYSDALGTQSAMFGARDCGTDCADRLHLRHLHPRRRHRRAGSVVSLRARLDDINIDIRIQPYQELRPK